MLIYVSGPYTKNGNGKSIKENIQQGADIAGKLWEAGHAVICPHTNTGEPYLNPNNCKATYDQYIAGDLHMVCYCDALVMTPDWETSKGAKIEKEYAESLGIPIYVWPEYPELHPTEVRCPQQVRAFREIVGKMYRTHLDKNSDYSPANILATGNVGLVTRLWDKVARFANLTGHTVTIDAAAGIEITKDNIAQILFYKMVRLLWMGGIYVRMSIAKTGFMKAPKNEPISDSLIDMAVYSVIGFIMWIEKWGK